MRKKCEQKRKKGSSNREGEVKKPSLKEGEMRKPGTKTKEDKSGSLVQRGQVRET
jgi:hypothetical protein